MIKKIENYKARKEKKKENLSEVAARDDSCIDEKSGVTL